MRKDVDTANGAWCRGQLSASISSVSMTAAIVAATLYAGAAPNIAMAQGAFVRQGNVSPYPRPENDMIVGDTAVGLIGIFNGWDLENNNGVIGNGAGSRGTAEVDGAGSTWINGGDLTIGLNGTGILKIADGGTVTNNYGVIGYNAGSSGTVTVSGAGSTWTNNNTIFVGNAGTGKLTISDGGVVSNSIGYIGYYAGSEGHVTVSGAGSAWTNDANLFVGSSGNGTLIIEDGGSVSNDHIFIGNAQGSKGAVTVTGAGSIWNNSGNLNVGNYGNGTLIIEDGGAVSASQGYIGIRNGSTGTVTVSGAGSTWSNAGNIILGQNGTGTLNIEKAGLANAGNLLMGINTSSVGITNLLGDAADGRGVLETGNITVGAGEGTFNWNGGIYRLTADNGDLFRGFNGSNSKATMTIGGEGAFLDSNGHDATIGIDLASAEGGFTKLGAGTVTLSGNNSYAGSTNVQGGTLWINGDQSAANGLTNVANGGTLGGTGIIGGDVVIANGGVLSAGADNVGTLTINGDLSLSGGSVLNFRLGEAGVAGGGNNDLVAVGGDLTLAGTVNVTPSTGTSLDTGLYTLITYGGSLTDNGSSVGMMPTGSDGYIQTSVAGQVNLINTGGATLNFWDGTSTANSDGVIHGGGGVWDLGISTANWTTDDGALNVGYKQDSLAIFTGQAGTVTVDNSKGQVQSAGMQFATDGYRLDGDALALIAPQNGEVTIRVGDGSGAGAAMVARIDNDLSGNARLVKSDLGTLILNGANSYAGGTTIKGGTLQISNDNNLGLASGDIRFSGGTLAITDDVSSDRAMVMAGNGGIDVLSGKTYSSTGDISGDGTLTKMGDGTWNLKGTVTSADVTIVVKAGQLIGDVASLSGSIINEGSVLFDQGSDAAYNGDISASGAGASFNKDGTGALTLTGMSDARWSLNNGTLITDMSRFSGDVAISGPAIFRVQDAGAASYAGSISGNGLFLVDGAGSVLLTGDSSGFSGSTQVRGGTLYVGNHSNPVRLGGSFTLYAGATLGGAGFAGSGAGSVVTHQAGSIIAPGNSIGTLTLDGDYVGSGGTFEFETVLGNDSSATDFLTITGSTSGNALVHVTNQGGAGAPTVEGIKIIDIGGTSGATFTLKSDYLFQNAPAVVAGAYAYRLYQGGVSTPNDGDWYLRSSSTTLTPQPEPQPEPTPLYQPGVPVYEAYTHNLQALNELGTWQQRNGNRAVAPGGFWGRVTATRLRPTNALSTTNATIKNNIWKAQIGTDLALYDGGNGNALILGMNGYYGRSNSSIGSFYGDGHIKTRAMGVGGSLSWYQANGLYLDVQGQYSAFDSTLDSNLLGRLATKNDGTGVAASVELGKRSQISRTLSITPQVQTAWSHVSFNGFTDPYGTEISSDHGSTLKSRMGLMIDHANGWTTGTGAKRASHVYAVANISYDWKRAARVDVSGIPIVNRANRVWGELGLGASYGIDRAVTIYTQGNARSAFADFTDSYALSGVVGVKIGF
ncbi:MAG: autotransporter outer membrane beta-barrel domain-containing protein [Sphingobium sp.]|nr:autotransporter outer membrane beta-barrel domain-containing protein [Sphingobium sp.]